MEIPFFKYHGTGNDFVMIDNREGLLSGQENAFFEAICHRRFGIGADGVILLNSHAAYDFEMDYFNSDGGRSSMCGNGGRCIVQFAHDLGMVSDTARFIATDGEHLAALTPSGVKLKMVMPHGFVALGDNDYWIHTGSPHFVRLQISHLADLDVVGLGRTIRNSAPWQQEGTNVNFVELLGPGHASVRTYERGVEDETWSCGTGVTAVAEVLAKTSSTPLGTILLETPGGNLQVHIQANEAPWLEGPAQFVFQGSIPFPIHA